MFFIRQHLSCPKVWTGKISKSFSVRWHQLTHARKKNTHNLAEVSFFLLVRGKFKETSVKQGKERGKERMIESALP